MCNNTWFLDGKYIVDIKFQGILPVQQYLSKKSLHFKLKDHAICVNFSDVYL